MTTQSLNDIEHSKNIRFLPLPGKKQPIGFCRFPLFDASRQEKFNKRTKRQFEVLVWYPGAFEAKTRKEYLSGQNLKNLLLLRLRFGRKAKEVSQIKTNSFVEIPISDNRERYPVLLFSHDIGMLPEYYSSLMEHLASEGYVVFSINHPYLSEACSITSPTDPTKKATVLIKKRLMAFSAFLSFNARRLLLRKPYDEKWKASKEVLQSWHSMAQTNSEAVLDRRFLITFLEQLDSKFFINNSPYNIFSSRLALDSIAVIGHGWGGASAVQALVSDSRIKAAVNLDGFQFDNVANQTIEKPLLMIYSEKNSRINEGIYFCSGDYETFTIKNSRHSSFADWSHYLTKKNEPNSQALFETMNLVIHFFDKHLKKVDYTSAIQANK